MELPEKNSSDRRKYGRLGMDDFEIALKQPFLEYKIAWGA